ncbi:glycosyltransferase [Streptosporangium sp. NPDC049046]|uniref:glycosyltransferase n=1 Tax=unclassified Streptosporangium TaxID=2632669 RepID=UPI003434AB1C
MRSRDVFFLSTDGDSMGGSQRVIHTLAQGLGSRGHRVTLISINPSRQPQSYIADPVYRHATLYDTPAPEPAARSLPWRRGRQRRSPEEVAAARRKLLRLTDRIDGGHGGYMVIASPWAAHWIADLPMPHIAKIGQYHQSYTEAVDSPNLKLIKKHYAHLDKALFLCDDYAASFTAHRLANCGTMLNPVSVFPEEAAPLRNPRIVSAGRLVRVKRIDLLIDAFAAAAPAVAEPWELHVIGDGPLRAALEAQAAQTGLGDRIVFRGQVENVEAEYLDASIVTLSSDFEGWGLVLAEGAACGLPAVACDASAGVRTLVEDGDNGILAEPGDTGSFAAALERLMSDAELRRRMGARGRERMRRYRLPRVLERWEALFDELDR